MIHLIAAVALSQQQRDSVERRLYRQMLANRDAIIDTQHPGRTLKDDERRAEKCYIRLHLYKADSCEAEFGKVEQDLKEARKKDADE